MKIAVTFFLLSGFTMLLQPASETPTTPTPRPSPTSLAVPISVAVSTSTPEAQSDKGIVEPTQQPDDAKLVFASLEIDQTNRGTININGYDRHFSVTFPISYNNEEAYPVVLFFHGCRCRRTVTDETVLSYLDWSPRLEPYKEDFIVVRMSAYSEKKPEIPRAPEDGGARGMWFWHEVFGAERDDFAFVHTVLKELLSSSDINVDPENIFGVGHSSGSIFLLSYVLGGYCQVKDAPLGFGQTAAWHEVASGSGLPLSMSQRHELEGTGSSQIVAGADSG